jgi:hypothetical protein
MSDCGTIVHSGTVTMSRGVGLPFHGGLVVMGTVGVTMLHF